MTNLACTPNRRKVRRILIVDDCHDTAQGMQRLLELRGYDAETATSGSAAISLAVNFRPEVVLLDLNLPDMDGFQVAHRILAQSDELVQLVAISGQVDRVTRQLAEEAGMSEFMPKPLQLESLIDALQRLEYQL